MIDPLTLDHLRVLVAIAELGSFSAAARRLQRVQSAISQSVRSLEAALAIRIFDRARKYPVLTPAGAALVAAMAASPDRETELEHERSRLPVRAVRL